MTKQRQVAERFHPGEYLRMALDERGFSSVEFAGHCGEIGLNDIHILEVIREQRPINKVLAYGITQLMGGDMRILLNLQKAYDEWRPKC